MSIFSILWNLNYSHTQMTYYHDCGLLPFGWSKKKAVNVGECGTSTILNSNKCEVDSDAPSNECPTPINCSFGTVLNNDSNECEVDTNLYEPNDISDTCEMNGVEYTYLSSSPYMRCSLGTILNTDTNQCEVDTSTHTLNTQIPSQVTCSYGTVFDYHYCYANDDLYTLTTLIPTQISCGTGTIPSSDTKDCEVDTNSYTILRDCPTCEWVNRVQSSIYFSNVGRLECVGV